ncbi:MAG: hypothetical protein O3A25_19220 [Acidobacteria bacterium]|nr:hypothetical protein [Acidobacteriota bacterium]
MREIPLFDLGAGLARRDDGRTRAAESQHRAEIFHRAQALAFQLALTHPDRTTTADAVYAALAAEGWDVSRLGPAAGKVFADGRRWQQTGERIQSTRVSNNGRWIMVWQLRPDRR